jgi:hypothetical protein
MATSEPNKDIANVKRRRMRWVMILGGFLIGAALAYVHFYLYLPMGSGPAGPKVDRAAFEQPWTNREVLLVGIGDSVAVRFGATESRDCDQQ